MYHINLLKNSEYIKITIFFILNFLTFCPNVVLATSWACQEDTAAMGGVSEFPTINSICNSDSCSDVIRGGIDEVEFFKDSTGVYIVLYRWWLSVNAGDCISCDGRIGRHSYDVCDYNWTSAVRTFKRVTWGGSKTGCGTAPHCYRDGRELCYMGGTLEYRCGGKWQRREADRVVLSRSNGQNITWQIQKVDSRRFSFAMLDNKSFFFKEYELSNEHAITEGFYSKIIEIKSSSSPAFGTLFGYNYGDFTAGSTPGTYNLTTTPNGCTITFNTATGAMTFNAAAKLCALQFNGKNPKSGMTPTQLESGLVSNSKNPKAAPRPGTLPVISGGLAAPLKDVKPQVTVQP